MSNSDPRALRDAFGSFMTGVTVVTAVSKEGEPVGFTANSFSSVSLEPPLLLVCPAKSLSTFATFTEGEHFCINVLASSQQNLSNTFAAPLEDRFARVEWFEDRHGCPTFPGVLARFSCSRHAVHDAGDHAILVGEVTDFRASPGQGLGYSRGGYFNLEMERAAQRSHVEHAETQVGVLLRRDNELLFERQNGKLSLPGLLVHEDDDSVTSLSRYLAHEHAVTARIDMVYSLFEDDEQRSAVYYRGFVEKANGTQLQALRIDELANAEFHSRAEKSMVMRYVQETQTGNHKLYVGDRQRGQTHQLTGDNS